MLITLIIGIVIGLLLPEVSRHARSLESQPTAPPRVSECERCKSGAVRESVRKNFGAYAPQVITIPVVHDANLTNAEIASILHPDQEPLDMNPIIFVWPSSLDGDHPTGAAYTAEQDYGAVKGINVGRNAQSYALPIQSDHKSPFTNNGSLAYAKKFVEYAKHRGENAHEVFSISGGFPPNVTDYLVNNAPINCQFQAIPA